jgi:hypothetical protein
MLEYISFDELLLTVGSHSAPIGVVGGIHLFLVVSGFWSVRFFLTSSGSYRQVYTLLFLSFHRPCSLCF